MHMHMHTCSSRSEGGDIRGGCGAPEPLEQAQQEERRENQAQGPVDPGVEQQTQGKPRCMFYYFKL